jgi:hypothetical protein
MVLQMLLCGECHENVQHLKAYKLSVVQGVEQCIATLAIQYTLHYQ